MKLAIFDLDNTLLAGDSDHEWGQFLIDIGCVDREFYEAANQRFFDEYRAGTLDIYAYSAFALKPLSEQSMDTLLQWRHRFIEERIKPMVAPGARALIARHVEQGDQLLLTTATNHFVTEPIAALLGFDNLIATDPEIIDGRITGRLTGTPNFQGGKIVRLNAWLAERELGDAHMTCYSDSRNDIPLLERGTVAIAVDPDPVLREEAQRRGWPIISLR